MIVLMSDFGSADGYVAAMKGVISSICPAEPLLDATHEVPPQDIAAGAWALANYVPFFPADTIHVAVVDPGVGTNRNLVMVEAGGQRVLAPDNGLVSIWLSRHANFEANIIRKGWHRPGQLSSTFHGRDILAYAAALMAADKLPGDALQKMNYPLMRLPESIVQVKKDRLTGQVIHIDRFGNAITGITRKHLDRIKNRRKKSVVLPFGTKIPLKNAYAEVGTGKSLALMNSSDHLEIAVHAGNASLTHGLVRGSQVELVV